MHTGLPRWCLVVKNPPANAGDIRDAGCIPGLDPQKKGMATHSTILTYRIPIGLQTVGCQHAHTWCVKGVMSSLEAWHDKNIVYVIICQLLEFLKVFKIKFSFT